MPENASQFIDCRLGKSKIAQLFCGEPLNKYFSTPLFFNLYLEEGLDFCVEPPPLPVPQLEVGSAVPLEDSDGVQLLDPLLVVPGNSQSKFYFSSS